MSSSRIANTILPYTSWLGYALQLGYVGYNLYQSYQSYLVPFDRDSRNGRERSLNNTIELVIKPRRRTQTRGGQNDAAPAQDKQFPSQVNQEAVSGETVPSDRETDAFSDPPSEFLGHSSHVPGPDGGINVHQQGLDDITCVYCSRSNQENHQPGPSAPSIGGAEGSGGHYHTHGDEDLLSNASTSLESTDSNRGIIYDIYSECFICARSLNDLEKPVATLPFCMHPFHKTCLDGVLKWHPKCPICSSNIFSPV